MKKNLYIILVLSLVILAGCRASREVHTTQQQHQSSNIDVEAHRLDSLWSLLVERYRVHVEFFNPNEVLPQNNQESTNLWTTNQSTKATQQGTAPCLANHPIDSSLLTSQRGNDMGWFGAVKSIDIEAERTQSEQSLSQTDSTAVCKTESDEARQTEKASEARQDNGTWAIVSIVAAVAFIVALIIVLKKFTKK